MKLGSMLAVLSVPLVWSGWMTVLSSRGRCLTRPERGGEAVLTDVIELAQSLKGGAEPGIYLAPIGMAFVNWWCQKDRYAAMQRFAGWAFQLLTGFNVEHRCRYT